MLTPRNRRKLAIRFETCVNWLWSLFDVCSRRAHEPDVNRTGYNESKLQARLALPLNWFDSAGLLTIPDGYRNRLR